MSDTETGFNLDEQPVDSKRNVKFVRFYVKDLSFEVPHGPMIHEETFVGEKMNVEHRITKSHHEMYQDMFEVVLHISVHAKVKDQTLYLLELEQAGIFRFYGFNEEQKEGLLEVGCPNNLLPYARELVSSLTVKGGFPPLLLQPANFLAAYQASKVDIPDKPAK